MSQWGITDKNS